MVPNSLRVYGRKAEPWTLFLPQLLHFPPFSRLLSCWIFEIYCLFSDLIEWILSQRMPWLVKNIFPPCSFDHNNSFCAWNWPIWLDALLYTVLSQQSCNAKLNVRWRFQIQTWMQVQWWIVEYHHENRRRIL